jgi:phage terminase small subunit
MPKGDKLTDKQEKFCNEYLIDLNATQAAIRAGYSKNYAEAQGYKLLENVGIQKRLTELRRELNQRAAEDENTLTAEKVLQKLSDVVNNADLEKVKPSEALKALELLAKHHGLFDKDNQQRNFSLNDILDALPEDFAAQVRAELRILIAQRGNKAR